MNPFNSAGRLSEPSLLTNNREDDDSPLAVETLAGEHNVAGLANHIAPGSVVLSAKTEMHSGPQHTTQCW